ncbi:abortive infection system antitoxin AbiGi family protein [Allorhizocola rhizosphaerae]|uniref:abortive infection system antitoxin AbiGi family protein n=1 Tax=Allorhizocola rhizosphaerae TaxID=1872709 RepID=UPI0013C2E7F6|nr:abortive infection system antitoxin AbiGi family protein [Allorhizocola rhizosphaerae]
MGQYGGEIPQHLLGYRRDPKWRDMSDYLVHFTKSEEDLVSILQDGEIRAGGPFGSATNLEERLRSQKSVCLSEIPLDQLNRLMARHGRYGLGFTRDYVRQQGGARVWYLDHGTPAHVAFNEMVRQAMIGGVDPAAEIWKLTPFIDRVTPGRYEFEWEREWRIVGGLRFEYSDLAFVLLPDGDRQEVEQEVAIEAPYIHHNGSVTGWIAIPEALGNKLDEMTAEFLETFGDPNDHLPWDEGEFVWLVPQWSTVGAVEYLFSDLGDSVREQLVDYLDGLSSQWLRISDMKEFAEGA